MRRRRPDFEPVSVVFTSTLGHPGLDPDAPSPLAWLGETVGSHPQLIAGSLHRFFAWVVAVGVVLALLYYFFVQRPAAAARDGRRA